MKSEALVMTFDFGRGYFNAIAMDTQLMLISCKGIIISLPNNVQAPLPEKAGNLSNKLADFFKSDKF